MWDVDGVLYAVINVTARDLPASQDLLNFCLNPFDHSARYCSP